MTNRNYIMYLEDIIHCIDKIEQYTSRLSYEKFAKDSLVFDAVIRNLEVIGEASRNVPEEVMQQYSDVP